MGWAWRWVRSSRGCRWGDDGGLGLADVIVDGQGLERRQRPNQNLRAIALDQLLRLGLGNGRLAGSVGGDDLDLPAAHFALVRIDAELEAFFHLPAASASAPDLTVMKPTFSGSAASERARARPNRSGTWSKRGRRSAACCTSLEQILIHLIFLFL